MSRASRRSFDGRRRRPRRSEGGRQGDPARPGSARRSSRPTSNYGRLRHPAQFIASILRAFGAQIRGWHRRERRLSESPERGDGHGCLPAAVGVQLFLPEWHRRRHERRARSGVRHLDDVDGAQRAEFRQHDRVLHASPSGAKPRPARRSTCRRCRRWPPPRRPWWMRSTRS